MKKTTTDRLSVGGSFELEVPSTLQNFAMRLICFVLAEIFHRDFSASVLIADKRITVLCSDDDQFVRVWHAKAMERQKRPQAEAEQEREAE